MTLITCAGNAQSETALIKQKWILVSATADVSTDLNNRGTASTDLFAQYPPCSTDDIYHFKDKGVFINDENKEICQLPKTYTGSWSIKNNDSIRINFGRQNLIMTFKMVRVSKTDMLLRTRQSLKSGAADVLYSFRRID
ncbi:lipocalin family protein [Flaviaesturariibacter amylovorans]